MFNISNNGIITVNRGDTFSLTFKIELGTKLAPIQYILTPADKLYLGVVEPNQQFEYAIIKKVLTDQDLDSNNNVIIKFLSEDTEYLLPGVYYYTLKLCRDCDASGEQIDTLKQRTKFIVLE